MVVKSGITDYLGLKAGDDLQLDATKWENAAILLGMLLEGYEQLLGDKNQEKRQHWKRLGTQALKYNHSMIESSI